MTTLPHPDETADESTLLADHSAHITATARRLHHRYPALIDYEDLHQEATLGFLLGIRSWDPTGGASLKTWGTRRMEGQVLDEIRNRDRLSRRDRQLVRAIRTHDPEILHGLTPKQTADATRLALVDAMPAYLDAPVGGPDSATSTLGDLVAAAQAVPGPEETVEAREQEHRVHAAIQTLPVPLRTLIILRYREGLAHADTAVVLGWSESWSSKQEKVALGMLRQILSNHSGATRNAGAPVADTPVRDTLTN